MTIRPATDMDFEAIYSIWLDGIAQTFAGCLLPATLREQFYYNFATSRFPFGFWVAEAAGEVEGWCSILPAFSHPLKQGSNGEVSTYVRPGGQLRGIGSELMQQVFACLEATNLDVVWGFANPANAQSIRMCERAGMRVCGATATKTILVNEYSLVF